MIVEFCRRCDVKANGFLRVVLVMNRTIHSLLVRCWSLLGHRSRTRPEPPSHDVAVVDFAPASIFHRDDHRKSLAQP